MSIEVTTITMPQRMIYGMRGKSSDKLISKDIPSLSKKYYEAIGKPSGSVLPFFVLSHNYSETTKQFDLFIGGQTEQLFGSGGLIWEEEWQLFQVGYNIMKTHWNYGYTTEAMKAILNFAAMNLGIKKIAGGHAKENLASAKVLEKLGFVYDRDDITPHVDGIRFFDSREYLLELD